VNYDFYGKNCRDFKKIISGLINFEKALHFRITSISTLDHYDIGMRNDNALDFNSITASCDSKENHH